MRKHGLYANLKKCWIHEDEVWILGFIILAQEIRMEEKEIEAVKDWLEPQSIKDIQVFLDFANFYRRFIRNFNRITTSLISIFQITDDNNLYA